MAVIRAVRCQSHFCGFSEPVVAETLWAMASPTAYNDWMAGLSDDSLHTFPRGIGEGASTYSSGDALNEQRPTGEGAVVGTDEAE